MPAKSAKQERFMRAVAHSPSFAKKVDVPMSVGREFTKAEGGEMKESKAMMKKEVSFMKKKGAPKSMVKHEMAEAGMNYGGKVKKMAMGGVATSKMGAVKTAAPSKDGVAVKGKTRGKQIVMAGGKGMKSGGKAGGKYC
jgi:hypothetical protein